MRGSIAAEKPTDATILAELRAGGWAVAVHNDYRMAGKACTFWLLTHPNGRWVKGEGNTDLQALVECQRQIARRSLDGNLPQPCAVRIRDSGPGRGTIDLEFNTTQQAEQFWRWAEREIANAAR